MMLARDCKAFYDPPKDRRIKKGGMTPSDNVNPPLDFCGFAGGLRGHFEGVIMQA
jgi:hypothetical protein